MIDAQTVLARWRDWVQAFREARPERLGTSERMCIHLWDALAASQVRVEAMMLHKLAPSLSGPPECLDFAGRVTPYGAAYAEGYRARQAEIEAAALSAGEVPDD